MTAARTGITGRHSGREQSARGFVPWVILALTAAAVSAGGYWLVNSPALDVDVIEVYGAQRTDPGPLLEVNGLREGTGLVWVKAGTIEAALEADPWVAHADVRVVYPDTVEVSITEYRATAWVGSGTRWILVSPQGTVLESADAPRTGLPRVDMPALHLQPGDTVTDGTALAAVGFLTGLTLPAVMWTDGAGLWAEVAGTVVKLGRPERMAEKAAIVAALLTEPKGDVVLDLTAPDRPAIRPSVAADLQPLVEGGGDTP